jgi:hypothetical protein
MSKVTFLYAPYLLYVLYCKLFYVLGNYMRINYNYISETNLPHSLRCG